jgi:hypothetical protein
MKTIKKIGAMCAIILFGFSLNPIDSTAQSIDIQVPEQNVCRCKHDGCYGGNAISLRPRCGQGDCSTQLGNCA